VVNEYRKQTWSVISLTSLSQPLHPFLPYWCNTPPSGTKLVQWHSRGNDMVPDVTPCAHVHTSIHLFQSCKRISYMFMLIITNPLDKMHDRYLTHQHLPSKSISISLMFIENFSIQNGVQYLFTAVFITQCSVYLVRKTLTFTFTTSIHLIPRHILTTPTYGSSFSNRVLRILFL